jgi:hypothetical protein
MNNFRKTLTFNHLSDRIRLRPEHGALTELALIVLLKGSLVVVKRSSYDRTGSTPRIFRYPTNPVWLIFIIVIILNYNGLVQ